MPLDQFVGLTFLASKDKTKLICKLTSKASAVVNSYADVSPLEASPKAVAEAAATSTDTPGADEIAQTVYVPVLFPNCSELQWALIDTGAQVSLITTTCAKYCNLVDEQYRNVLASNLRVGGVNGKPW